MGYRVVYSPEKEERRTGTRLARISVMTVWFLAGFCILVKHTWTEGVKMLRNLIVTDELAVMAVALENTAQQVGTGERLGETLFSLWNGLLQFIWS